MKKELTRTILTSTILAFTSLITCAQDMKTTGFVQLLPAYQGKIELTTNDVTVYLNGPSDRWFAMGFNAQSMTLGTDVIYYANGSNGVGIYDGRLVGFQAPLADVIQNWQVLSNTINGMTREIVATRPLNSGDALDYIFSFGLNSLNIIFSHGATATTSLAYHQNNRGITTVQFEEVQNPSCTVNGGTLSTFSARLGLCKGDAQPDYIQLSVSGNSGIGRYGLVRQSDLEIIDVNSNGSFNMENYDAGQYFLGHISVDNTSLLNGVTNASQLSGCFDLSNALPVTSFPLFGGALSINGPSTVCGGNVSVSITGNQGPNFRFALLNQLSSVVIDQNTTGIFDFTPLENGIYRIVHIAYISGINLGTLSPPFLPPCITPSNLVTIIKENCEAASLHTSPNPTTDISLTQFSIAFDAPVTLELYDMSGRKISTLFSQQAKKDQLYRVELDTSNLPTGIYIYRLTTVDEIIVEKVIVGR